jgi:glutamate synthase domain-containing protein 3
MTPAPQAPEVAPDALAIDLALDSVRSLNERLHAPDAPAHVRIVNPAGKHSIAVGLDGEIEVVIDGHVGYYCAGMNKHALVRIAGNCGPGLAENMMSGTVVCDGNASQCAGATGRGGMLAIGGDAAARCGISLKGTDIVVRGSVGHLSAFMAQKGSLVVCGDAGDSLGDSLYEAHLYVRGTVASLGADCVEKEMGSEHTAHVAALLAAAGIDDVSATDFRRYGSARRLYHFHADNLGSY